MQHQGEEIGEREGGVLRKVEGGHCRKQERKEKFKITENTEDLHVFKGPKIGGQKKKNTGP